MANSKFLKAKCRSTGRWYGLEMRQFGGKWKVVNMISLSDDEAKVISSEIKQDSYETNSNLLACPKCGTRKVGSCTCSKKAIVCSKNMKYRFGCIYCNELEIDYSLPTREDVAGISGKTVTLSQGQEVKIRYADGRSLSRIYVGVGWDPAEYGENIDVDSSVFVMPESGPAYGKDIVYFGNLHHASGCIDHHGDNLTGDGRYQSDDENISVYLDKVPRDRSRLAFVLNIYRCDDRNQTLGVIKNLYIKIYDPDSKNVLIKYDVLGNFRRDTALIIGMAYRSGDGWSFKAIGKGSRAKNINELALECSDI